MSEANKPSTKVALVLGATGGIGGEVADALVRHGWTVRGMARDPGEARQRARAGAIEWVAGDAMVAADVARAARGVSVIVHAVNPPGYRNWGELVLPMIDHTIAAARAEGARIVLPGTLYNFDPATTPLLSEASLQQPRSHKGAIRVELERRLEAASAEAPVLIVRAGDFFGPRAKASWFSQAMVRPGRPVTRLVNPAKGVGHSWAFLPDLAEAMARLLDVPERLRSFERVQFEGLWDNDGKTMPAAICDVIGEGRLAEYAFPWWLMRALAVFGGFPREANDIAATFRHPVRLDNRRLEELIGPEPRTPLVEAVHMTLGAMGCLPDPSPLAPLTRPRQPR